MNNYTSFIISNKPEIVPVIQLSISPEPVTLFDGTGCASFSRLVNSCAAKCNTEIVIMMSDKVLPRAEHVHKLLNLLNNGYGFVGLYRFAFFGFKKELFRKIGPMDERFVGGGFEDDDFYIRLKEANIAMYVTHDVPYNTALSSWDQTRTQEIFINKWIPSVIPNTKLKNSQVQRRLPENPHNYNFGLPVPTKFLSWEYTVATPSKARKYAHPPKYPKEIK
jgi:GT2 family glycosyltransferase